MKFRGRIEFKIWISALGLLFLTVSTSANNQDVSPYISNEALFAMFHSWSPTTCNTNHDHLDKKTFPPEIKFGPIENRRQVTTIGERTYYVTQERKVFLSPNAKLPVVTFYESKDWCKPSVYVFHYISHDHLYPDSLFVEKNIERIDVYQEGLDQLVETLHPNTPYKKMSEIYARSERREFARKDLNNKTLVGVIDSGVDYNHPAVAFAIERLDERIKNWKAIETSLEQQIVFVQSKMKCRIKQLCENELKYLSSQKAYVGFKIIEEKHSLDRVTGDETPWDVSFAGTELTYGHGTHVAGIIARNKDVRILPIRGFFGYLDSAVQYLSYRGARVINMSFGGKDPDTLSAIPKMTEILFVTSAGNGTRNGPRNIDLDKHYPASLKSPNLISVASVNSNNVLEKYSNYGANTVHIAAVGGSVRSSIPNGKYARYSGTSFATPQVARTAARMLNENPTLSPEQIIQILLATGDRIPELSGKVICGCVLNETKAVQAAKEAVK